MQDKYLNKLEYNKILDILETFAKTIYGKKLCLELKPFTKKETVFKKLSETNEAFKLIDLKGNLPIYELEDVSIYIKTLEAEQFLSQKALLDIANVLSLSRNLKEYFIDRLRRPALRSLFQITLKKKQIIFHIYKITFIICTLI